MVRCALALAVLVACNSSSSNDRAVFDDMKKTMHPHVDGKLVSTGGTLGTWELAPDLCKSGEHYGYFGVDFYAPHDDHTRLRFVKDESRGLSVKVIIPGSSGDAIVFTKEDCATLEGNVSWMNEGSMSKTGPQAGKMFTHVEGHLRIDCHDTPPGQSHIAGELQFAHCD